MIPPELLAAFRATRFIVHGAEGGPAAGITLRVDQKNPALDRLLAQRGVRGCAFITAWNPGAVRLPAGENARRQAALAAAVRAAGYECWPGEGVGADGFWPAEDSLLILGISRPDALALGRQFGQLAIVYARRGEPVELLIC